MKPQLLMACDFDGTMTRQDTLVEILNRFGSTHWTDIQARVVAGELSIREGLQSEMGSVRASPDQLRDLLSSRIELDPGFPRFYQAMRSKGIPVVVLTGGFDFCVETVLREAGCWPIPLLANRLIPPSSSSPQKRGSIPDQVGDDSRNRWRVDFPYPSPRCGACGHCKGDPIREWTSRGYTTVFMGNGVTDRCAARAASLTFAKDELEDWCRRQNIPVVRFETFDDVQKEMEEREWL